jgi:hypothetical protein
VRRTFLETMDAKDLPEEFLRQVKASRFAGPQEIEHRFGRPAAIPFESRRASPCTRGCGARHRHDRNDGTAPTMIGGGRSRAPYIDMLIPSQIDQL